MKKLLLISTLFVTQSYSMKPIIDTAHLIASNDMLKGFVSDPAAWDAFNKSTTASLKALEAAKKVGAADALEGHYSTWMGVVGGGVASLFGWYAVAETVSSTAKKAVDTANVTAKIIDKNTEAPTSPRTKRAKEEVDTLSLQQLQLLAATEEQSSPDKTYWRGKYQQALKNQPK